MYHISARSCNVLTNIAFFILSPTNPCAPHTALTTNQNWSGSSFPTPLNTGNFITLIILDCGGRGGGVGGDGGDDSETGCSVGGGGMHGIHCLIRLITLIGETFVSSSSFSHEGEIKGLFSTSVLPSFLYILPLRMAPNMKYM